MNFMNPGTIWNINIAESKNLFMGVAVLEMFREDNDPTNWLILCHSRNFKSFRIYALYDNVSKWWQWLRFGAKSWLSRKSGRCLAKLGSQSLRFNMLLFASTTCYIAVVFTAGRNKQVSF